MSENNANYFDELSLEWQQNLLNYITDNFISSNTFNTKHTAYGLKQRYTRLFINKEHHVTSRCFMEAMLEAGFQAKPMPNASEPNWYFNIREPKFKD